VSRLTADDLIFNVERNGGSFETTTVNGQKLRVFVTDGKLKMADGKAGLRPSLQAASYTPRALSMSSHRFLCRRKYPGFLAHMSAI